MDVERVAPVPEVLDLAAHFLSPRERAHLRACEGGARQSAFFRLWTRKEALLKAAGTGITVPLAAIDTLAGPGAALLVDLATSPGPAAPPRTRDGALPPGYAGALATAVPNWRRTA